MESEMRRLLERIPKEKHEFALQTLAIIASIKEECKKNKKCINCRFHVPSSESLSECIFNKEDLPEDYNEYEITERIYE